MKNYLHITILFVTLVLSIKNDDNDTHKSRREMSELIKGFPDHKDPQLRLSVINDNIQYFTDRLKDIHNHKDDAKFYVMQLDRFKDEKKSYELQHKE